jgi:transcription elongation factor GreB
MGRWRPPQKSSSPYITPQGAQALKAELKHLWGEVRPEVVRALAAAAAEGDRSENAEYTYRKKQLGGIDRRIRYLSRRLDVLQVIDRIPEDRCRVRFGAWVSLKCSGAPDRRYRIVGADEIDAGKGWISIDSPVARALLGRRVGDEIEVRLPDGNSLFEVLEVHYDPDPEC